MANVVHPPLNFIHEPAHLPSSRFGFGFGLPGNTPAGTGKQPVYTPGHTQPSAFQQLTSHINLPPASHRVQKRRLESEDDAETSRHAARDVPMDRSPTPERLKRSVPKRAKVSSQDNEPKDQQSSRTSKSLDSDGDVDIGVLLASLPPQALLPLLNSLMSIQPSLKSLILPLIPRPTLDTAIQALEQSARKLRDAYPYSNTLTPAFALTSVSATTCLGFGFGTNSQRCGFGSSMDDDRGTGGGHEGGGMRESYILSRLRPHIHEFVSACMAYVPYFSYAPCAQDSWSRGHATHKDKSHPTETFIFLSTLTTQMTCQPALTQASLAPLLLPRLSKEWMAWVERLDHVVNREGGMFGGETVKSWERALDEFAEMRGPEGWCVMREVRDRWVCKVGWLVGRTVVDPMEEEA